MITKTTTTAKPADEPTADFKALLDTMAAFAEAKTRLAGLEQSIQEDYLGIVDEFRHEFTKLQDIVARCETALEDVCLRNPQWFEKAKTLKTPFGSVAFRTTTTIEVPNEEVTIAILERMEDGENYLRRETSLNKEALEVLSDAELKGIRCRRLTGQSFSVKAGKIDLGKAVKKAAAAQEGKN